MQPRTNSCSLLLFCVFWACSLQLAPLFEVYKIYVPFALHVHYPFLSTPPCTSSHGWTASIISRLMAMGVDIAKGFLRSLL